MKKYDLADLKTKYKNKFDKHVGKYGITIRGCDLVARDMTDALERADQMIKAGDLKDGILYMIYVYCLSFSEEMYDRYDTAYNKCADYIDYWQDFFDNYDTDSFRDDVFDALLEDIEMIRYEMAKEALADFLFSEFGEPPYDTTLLAFAQDEINKETVRGNSTFEYYRYCVPLWFHRGIAPRKLARSLMYSYTRDNAQMAFWLIDQTDDLEMEYCLLQYFKDWLDDDDDKYQQRLEEDSKKVPGVYRVFDRLLEKKSTDFSDYQRWSKRFPEDIWPLQAIRWFSRLEDQRKSFSELTQDGFLIDRAYTGPYSRCGYLKLKDVKRLSGYLKDDYPYQLYHLYYETLRNMRNAHGRNNYNKIADTLESLEDCKGGSLAVPIIINGLLAEDVHLRLFREIMAERFPEYVKD